MRKLRPISKRQLAFAREFVRTGGNATAAAVHAGYSVNGAHVAGNRLLRQDVVMAAIAVEIAAGVPDSDAALRRLNLAYRSVDIRARLAMLRASEAVPASILPGERPFVVIDRNDATLRDHVARHAKILGIAALGVGVRCYVAATATNHQPQPRLRANRNRIKDAVALRK